MPDARFESSVSITAAAYDIRSRAASGDATRASWDALATDTPDLDAALRAAEFAIVEDVELNPVAPTGLRAASEDRTIAISVDAAPGESAVVLVEDASGLLSWRVPDAPAPGEPTRSGFGTLQFTIRPQTDPDAAPEPRRGIIGEKIFELIAEPVRVRVLKFLAARTIEAAVARIEGGLAVGPVIIGPGDPAAWTATNYAAALPRDLARDRPWRLLLMVHGTFSSTAASFGHLAGSAMLSQALEAYDLILGYDHKTLADTPEANAQAILGALLALDPPAGSTIDAVAFSRGGLVYRVLAEQLTPAASLRATFGKAIFVGCTNAGTLLAEPDNWATLVDVYTNAIAAGLEIGGALTGQVWATPIATYAIQTLGKFVQMLATAAISERQLPGLAAMEPDSEVVNALNGAALPANPPPYFTITANFDTVADAAPFARRAALTLANRVIDRLMDADNDLVVDTASMTHFAAGRAIGSSQVFAPADHVFHTCYFAHPDVPDQLADWLELSAASGGQRAELPERTEEVERGGMAGIGAAEMDTDFTMPVKDVFDITGRGTVLMTKTVHADSIDAGSDIDAGAPPDEPARSEKSAPPGPDPLDTSRYIAAEMAPFPKLGPPVNVYVTVSPEAISVADHAAAAATAEAVPLASAKPLKLAIIATVNCQVVGPDSCEIDLHGEAEALRKFKVQGLAAGTAELIVEARQGMQTVASFTLRPVFVAEAAAPLRSTATLAAPVADTKGQMVLRIYESPDGDSGLRLIFNLTGDDPEVAFVDERTINGFDARAYSTDVLKQVEQALVAPGAGGTSTIYDSFLEAMISDAQVRTDALIPEKIRRQLWKYRDRVTGVQVISNEPYIPWELMYLSDPDGEQEDGRGFLVEWGLVRWLHDAPLRRRRVATATGGKACVVPEYTNPRLVLKGAAEEREMLKARFPGIVPLEASSSAMRRWLATGASNCAILHFACHGGTKQTGVIDSKLLMQSLVKENGQESEDVLTWQDVVTHADFGHAGGPLVFVNACQTGQTGGAIDGMAGFAEAFLSPKSRRGAAAFIGALWSVNDTLAGVFANAVYTRLDAGDSLAEAVKAARKECQTKQNFTWLAYTVYGAL